MTASTTLNTPSQRSNTPTRTAAPTGAGRSPVAQMKGALRGAGGFEAQSAMLTPGGASGGSRLPAPVQAKMENAFGSDFGNVRVHQGGQAEAIGAKAFAQGNDIHFASGAYAPESQSGQELIGHELAHVVQQREGRVAPTMQAKGGFGVNTDVGLEAEADALGARAARGEVVRSGGGGSSVSGGVVQGLFVVSPEQATGVFGHDFDGNGAMRIADDGSMAAPAGEDVKSFYATKDHIKSSNKILEGAKSQFRLSAEGGADYTVRSAKNKEVALHKVVGAAPSRNERGGNLTGGPNCNQMAGAVMGSGKVNTAKKNPVREVKGTSMSITEASNVGLDLHRMVNNMAGGDGKKSAERKVTRFNEERKNRDQTKVMEDAHIFTVVFSDVDNARGRVNDCLMRWNGENRNCGTFDSGADSAIVKVHPRKAATFEDELRVIEDAMRMKDGNRRDDCIASITDTGATEEKWFGELDNSVAEGEDDQVLTDYDNLDPVAKDKAHKKIGLNEYASPEVGEAFGIHAVKRNDEDQDVAFPYHWAGVVAKSGADTVTLENYAGRGVDEVYFTMYGPQLKVDIDDRGVHKADDQGTKKDRDATTFHGQWKETFPGVNTITHATKMVGKNK